MTPMNDNIRDEIDELLEDLPNAWCQDCQHPRCLSKKQSAKYDIEALANKYATQRAIAELRHFRNIYLDNNWYGKEADDCIAQLEASLGGKE